MLIDGVRTGTMIEIKWMQGSLFNPTSDRVIQMVLLNPVLANIGTMDQRLAGWNCHIIYDSHSRTEIPSNKYYEVKWLKLCERQGNLRIISEAHIKDEANK